MRLWIASASAILLLTSLVPPVAAAEECPFGPTQPGTLLNVCYDLNGSTTATGVTDQGTLCPVGSVCVADMPADAVCVRVYIGGPFVRDDNYCVPTLCKPGGNDWPSPLLCNTIY